MKNYPLNIQKHHSQDSNDNRCFDAVLEENIISNAVFVLFNYLDG